MLANWLCSGTLTSLSQGQRPYGQQKWAHILVPMWQPLCDDECIGETSRMFGERYKEHLKDPSPIHQHSNHTGHPTSHNNFQIIEREGYSSAGNIKESLFIRVNNPTLNRSIGKFNLPHIWDRVLLNTSGLKLKRHAHIVGHVNSNNSNTPTVV